MYPRFSLVLSVNHACNMRCSYCYAGRKFSAPMPEQTGRKAIDRAIASTQPGGSLSLGFFGGEPLLEAGLIAKLIDCAYARAEAAEIDLSLSMTVNGTVTTDAAWALMTRPGLSLAVSCHGLPEVHDRYRRFPDGTGSARVVLNTIARLQDAGRDFRVVMVVRPDTVAALPEGIQFLREQGVTHVDPSLDLSTHVSLSIYIFSLYDSVSLTLVYIYISLSFIFLSLSFCLSVKPKAKANARARFNPKPRGIRGGVRGESEGYL